MKNTDKLFVRLIDEDVDVWRPVEGEHLSGCVYRIVPQPYDATTETWEFLPGDVVECEEIQSDGHSILVAVRKVTQI